MRFITRLGRNVIYMKFRSKKLIWLCAFCMIIGLIAIAVGYYTDAFIVAMIGIGLVATSGLTYPFICRCPYCGSLTASRFVSLKSSVIYHCPNCGEKLYQK
jgi:drug/metabolite transporter (DMT)-like permease